eukprot:TRINITY_DN2173_c0_g2_i1.p1 TRINITY_DN2173_c0_g2~~TRINITY_DN2173_c0_g2_i1.p1  ORF type:complete len:1338 (+),score=458.05 TRINITY_DN2173_c0_g2_i1:150-4016(+)
MIEAPQMSLKTKVSPRWTIQEAKTRFQNKFPAETAGYRLFIETPDNYLMLDEQTPLENFEDLDDGATLLFKPPTFKGTDTKKIAFSGGAAPQSPRFAQSFDPIALKELPPDDSPISPKAKTLPADALSEKKSESHKAKEFFDGLVVMCKKILVECKGIKEKVDNQADEDTIFECARETAQLTVELVNHVNEQATFLADKAQFAIVQSDSKTLRTNILSLITAARQCATNPLDFLFKQQFTNQCASTPESVRALIKSAEALLQAEEDQNTETVKSIEESQLAENLIKHTWELGLVIRNISSAVEKQDKELFVAVTRTAVATMNAILQIATDLKSEMYWDLKTATGQYITWSKNALTNTDAFVVAQVTQSQQTLRSLIEKFILMISKTNRQVLKGLPTQFPDFITFSQEDQEKQADYKLKRQLAVKIANIFSQKYEQFFRQWTQQKQSDAMAMIELLVREMTESGVRFGNGNHRKTFPGQGSEFSEDSMSPMMSPMMSPISSPPGRVSDADDLSSMPEGDADAMKELMKIMKAKDSSDWQQMAFNLKKFTTKLDINTRRKLEAEVNMDQAPVPEQLNKISVVFSDAAVELLLTITETVLTTDNQDVEIKSAALTKSVEHFFDIMKKVMVISRAWIAPPSERKEARAFGTMRHTMKQWTLQIECTEENVNYMKKLKLDVNTNVGDAVQKILEKLPVDNTKNWSLYLPQDHVWMQKDKKLADYSQLASEKMAIQLKELGTENSEIKKVILSLLDGVLNSIASISAKGEVQADVVAALTNRDTGEIVGNFMSVKAQLEESLQSKIYDTSAAIRVLAIQMISGLKVLAGTTTVTKDYTTLIQLAATCQRFPPIVTQMINAFETYNYIHVQVEPSKSPVPEFSASGSMIINSVERSVWQEDKMKPIFDEKEELKAASFNYIVTKLTSEDSVDTQFRQTFMITYQSFSTPSAFLEKLLQRYEVPSRIPEDKKTTIRLRVGIILKYWIENQFEDLDTKSIGLLTQFINRTLEADNQQSLASMLKKEIAKKQEEQTAKKKTQILELSEIKVTDSRSPAELFMALNESEIARQLSIIEFKMFSKIKHSELLNQAWNKKHLKYKASNILAMIDRANTFSFWVASLILSYQTEKERANVITKLLVIGSHLRELHNYNTLMGLIAGMSMSAIMRMKKSWSQVPQSAMAGLQSLHVLFDPSNSFKNYRSDLTLNMTKGAVLPYLGTYLSDLTFMEDGNPDILNGMINWSKRKLIANVVSQIQLLQGSSYSFPVVEPINTFLTELPHIDDKSLYQLSLLREPRA